MELKMSMFTTELFDGEESRVVFHFNKAHLQDKSIPMWVIKHKGKSYYVNHVDSTIGFSTKETPDNTHTQGSIMFRGCLQIDYTRTDEVEQRVALIRSKRELDEEAEQFEAEYGSRSES